LFFNACKFVLLKDEKCAG